METNQNLTNVLNKLKKLKALYEGAKKVNSENEANAAAAAIQRLLTQYNLSMSEIDLEEESKVNKIMQEWVSGFTYKSIGGKWERDLLTVICNHNFCKAFTYGKSHKNLVIFGKPENVETVKWLREFLSKKFVEFSKKRFKEYKESALFVLKPMSMDKYQRGYLLGCASGLDSKLREDARAQEQADKVYGAKVTALSLRNSQEIVEYVKTKFKITDSRKTSYKVDSTSFDAGYRDGLKTEINKQVSASRDSQVAGVGLLG